MRLWMRPFFSELDLGMCEFSISGVPSLPDGETVHVVAIAPKRWFGPVYRLWQKIAYGVEHDIP